MDLNVRVDINCGQTDGQMDRLKDRWKTRRLYRSLLKQVRQKMAYGFKVGKKT